MYISPHNHTMYSNLRLLDCIIKPNKLLDRALELNLNGIAITDHACLSGHVEIQQHYEKLKSQNKIPDNFKLIFGDEIYFTTDLESKGEYYHQILLAKDEIGHQLLREIETKAWKNSYNYKGMDRVPITFDEVATIIGNKKGHLISTSACLGSWLGKKISIWKELEKNNIQVEEIQNIKIEIHNYLLWCKEIFNNNFYLEVQPSDTFEQIQHNDALKVLSNAYQIPLVFATDSHYLKQTDIYFHECFLNSKDGDREVADFYKTTYLMTYEEIKSYLSVSFSDEEIETMRINSLEIGDKCEYYSLYKPQKVPTCKFDLSSLPVFENTGYKNIDRLLNGCNEDKYWSRYCLKNLAKKDLWNREYLERLDIEAEQLFLISEGIGQNLSSYFILMQKIIQLAWKHSLVGIGRGSSVAWLSNFLMDITGIDPVKTKLDSWWRFAHTSRKDFFDIDTDFNPLKKEEIMNELRNEFGEDNVINCATFGTCSSKSAIQTACRGLNIDNDTSQYISSMIPVDRGALWSLNKCFNGDDESKPVTEFVNEVAKYENLKEIALEFEGLIDKRGVHASAVYIFNEGISSNNSLMKSSSGLVTTQFSMKDSDYQSALKLDILWTEAQAKLQTCLELLIKDKVIEDKGSLKANYDEYLHPDKINQTDLQMWEKAYSGEIIDLFQYSTSLGLEALKKTKPITLNQATSTNCLMRLMGDSDTLPIDKYVLFKNDISNWYKEMDSYNLTKGEQELLEPYLLKDYGVASTQESMMECIMAIGCSMEQANKARKTIAKKVFRDIDNLKEMVFQVGTDNCTSMNLLNYIWDNVVEPQSGYSFSLHHSTVYSIIAIQMMNLYYFYPKQYWNTAVLIVNAGVGENSSSDYSKLAVAIGQMKYNNIKISSPDINESDLYFTPSKNSNKILYGLKGIVTINDEDVKQIINNRPYNSLDDFLVKCETFLETGKIVTLIKAGCFDEVENIDRYDIMKKYITHITNLKTILTTTNLNKLVDNSLLSSEFKFEQEMLRFRKFIQNKKFLYKTVGTKKWYKLDGLNTQPFFEKYFIDFMEEDKDYQFLTNGVIIVSDKSFDKIYKKLISKLLNWLQTNEALNIYNTCLLNENWAKYVKSNDTRTWSMESCCFYDKEHELSNIDRDTYNISNYFNLPENPVIINETVKRGRLVKTFKIDSLIGTVVDKNTTRHTISLLTVDGVVTVKFAKGTFNFYNKQVSKVDAETGKKNILEKSWFSRGTLLMLKGFRDNNQFRARAYNGHSVMKIIGIREEKYLWLQTERAGG